MKKIMGLGLVAALVISGCSAAQKARRDERDKMVQSKGVFCDFVSESDFKDIDIELNLRLAKKCDATKPFQISSYKRVSENPGVLYCCNTGAGSYSSTELDSPAAKASPAVQSENSKSESSATSKPSSSK